MKSKQAAPSIARRPTREQVQRVIRALEKLCVETSPFAVERIIRDFEQEADATVEAGRRALRRL